MFGKYRRSLQSDRRRLLEQFEVVQVARKVVGVGSVGQRAWVLLLEDDEREPIFLQAKQAQASVWPTTADAVAIATRASEWSPRST